MNNYKVVISFVVGALGGAGAAYLYLNDKFNQALDAEVESVKEYYKEKETKLDEAIKAVEEKETEQEIAKAEEIIENNNYAKISTEKKKTSNAKKTTSKKTKKKEPYVITPDDFGDANGYDKVTITYYSGDEVFADIQEMPVDNAEKLIGAGNLGRFGEYEDNVLYVRNEDLKTDYEVILEDGSYSDFIGE